MSATSSAAAVIVILLILGGLIYFSGGYVLPSRTGQVFSSIGPLLGRVLSVVQGTATKAVSTISSILRQVNSSVGSPAYPINSQWVASFMAAVNAQRASPLTENSTLDQFAAVRFHTLVSHYQISHYGYDQDFDSFFAGRSVAGSEVYFFPSSSPASFAQEVQKTAPVHWQGLVDPAFTHFGYYLGSGPVIGVYQPCSAPSEIIGTVNQTQQLLQYGCQFTVTTGTYLVIELGS